MSRVRDRIDELDLPLDDFAVEEVPIISVPGARSAQIMYVDPRTGHRSSCNCTRAG